LSFLRHLDLGLDSIRIDKSDGDCLQVHFEVAEHPHRDRSDEKTNPEIATAKSKSRWATAVQSYNPAVAAEG
jgi:hypothetical protein